MRPNGRELIAGIAEDPTFGPVVLFGRGGVAVEVINDKALALPPLDMGLARAQIELTRVSRLLRSYRDKPQADIDAVALTCEVIGSSMATAVAGPMPGSTPTAVPSAQPTKAHSRLMGVPAVAKPCISWFRISITASRFA